MARKKPPRNKKFEELVQRSIAARKGEGEMVPPAKGQFVPGKQPPKKKVVRKRRRRSGYRFPPQQA